MPKCLSKIPVVRVSSASTKSASFRVRMARSVMSSILPTGVGTMYKMPILYANIAIYIPSSKKSRRLFAIFKTSFCTFASV